MPVRWFAAALFAIVLIAQQIPPANFSGSIHGVSKKHITIETPEGNLLDFDMNGQTRILRGKKKISSQDLRDGDDVTIEAKQEPSRRQLFLTALTVTVSDKPKDGTENVK